MALLDDVRVLSANPTLSKLDQEALQLIAFSAETRIMRAGDVLFRKGEPSDGGYVVLKGAIGLDDGSDRETIVHPPALVGDTALVHETSRPCTAVAREASSILKIPRALFHRVLDEFPASAVRLQQHFGARLSALHGDLEKLHRQFS